MKMDRADVKVLAVRTLEGRQLTDEMLTYAEEAAALSLEDWHHLMLNLPRNGQKRMALCVSGVLRRRRNCEDGAYAALVASQDPTGPAIADFGSCRV